MSNWFKAKTLSSLEYSFCPSCKKKVGKQKSCSICKMPTIQIVENQEHFEIEYFFGKKFMIEKNLSTDMLNWYDATNYAKNLRKGGFSGWRLPTIEELKIIFEIKEALNIDKSYEWLWSSETLSDNQGHAWYMMMADGTLDDNDKMSGQLYVCCVR